MLTLTLTLSLLLLAVASSWLAIAEAYRQAQEKDLLLTRLNHLVSALNAARQSADDLQSQTAALSTELEGIRARRHAHNTILCFEDMFAVVSDLQIEIRQSFQYLSARTKNLAEILENGRPGPYAYRSKDTQSKPMRPGAIQPWKLK